MRRGKVLVLAACMACGDDKNDAGKQSALDEKKVSELDGKELRALCDWFLELDSKIDVSDEELCTQDAADYSESPEECVEYRDECLDELDQDQGDESCEGFSVSKSCTAEVGTLKKCLTDLTKLYEDAARNATCDEFEDAVVDDVPPECIKLQPSCLVFEVTSVSRSLRAR